ncbi:tRNA pseudouridine(55) synthase TruB [Campylobacter sp. MIT 97-5078]|uniref:tRNA pseudouridine(55) synthase TruB n=1 Tax=Campylobacter sp. MIT 97-5078 TaxID=1548153 RepID=UPI000513BCCA|nr:tRNA pseudouridine(55) synthase TruB [Campylobacter sp. MIT 97-5078]KGI55522.1 tRNA pseudouridine synthase B [Campylobacter sp. MIT 97-5078]TQR26978.1 tRNA pseudouridine(55) synthase TruB [Campylobacter sp. MIT 97-5078]
MNKLFVAYKPANISSNAFLSTLKKKYKVKKAGFSGTLDPFAKGVLIIAFNQYTKLFRFLDKTPKHYKATIWLGASSKSLDKHNITELTLPLAFSKEQIKSTLIKGELEFIPPQFSAKRVQGKRAYELAKRGEKAELKTCKMHIYECKMLHYMHPFLSIELSVSEGAYVRSYCEIIALKLGVKATLSALERLSEGKFVYNDEKSLNVLEYLNLKQNSLLDLNKLENGTKINLDELEIQDEGEYFIEDKDFFSVIRIKDKKVTYLLNKVEKC